MKSKEREETPDMNRDPISGAPGAHPVGTGIGATGGALAGAAIGAVGGPIGAAVGLAAGATVGGLAGKAIAEEVDPTAEYEYWRINYVDRPYVEHGVAYDVYEDAYRTGYEGWKRYPHHTYEDIENDLRRDYERSGKARLGWEKAKDAVRDAWDRVANSFKSEKDDAAKTYPYRDDAERARMRNTDIDDEDVL